MWPTRKSRSRRGTNMLESGTESQAPDSGIQGPTPRNESPAPKPEPGETLSIAVSHSFPLLPPSLPLPSENMKIILTGATGNTGGHALTRLLSLPTVTRIVVLARHPLSPAIDSPKIETLILTDAEFLDYPARVVDALRGASGAVWFVLLP